MPEKSKARKILEASAEERKEPRIRVTIIDDNAAEYSLNPYESVVRGILDPDTPDTFIEVPVPPALKGSVLHSYLHTSRIAKFYQHDEFTIAEDSNDDTGKQKAVKGG